MEKSILKKDNNNQQQRKMKAKNHFKNHILQQQTESDTPKKISFKLKIIQWLKQLPLDQRYLAVKVYAPGLSRKIQETLIDFQNDHIQQTKKDNLTNRKVNMKQAKQIIQSIVLISDGQQYFDSLGFDFSYIEHPDKLYQLLTLNLSNAEKTMYQSDQYETQQIELKETLLLVQKAQTRQQLASIIISFLRADIFIKYEQKKPINLQDQRNRKKQFSMFWRNLSEQNKKKILLLHKQDIKTLASFLEEKKIFIERQGLQKEIQDMIPMDKNQFCNKIFKCKLKRSLTYFTDYQQLIYKAWKNQLNKKKRRVRNQQQRINNQKSNNSQKPSQELNGKNLTQINQKTVKRFNKLIEKQKQGNNQKQKIPLQAHLNPKQKNLVHNSNFQKSSKKIIPSVQTNNGVNGNLNNNLINGNVSTNNKRKRNRNNNRRKKSVSAQSKQTKATSYKVGQEQVQKIQQDHSNNQTQLRSFSHQENLKMYNQQDGITQILTTSLLNKQQNPETFYIDEKMQSQALSRVLQLKDLIVDIPFVDYDKEVRKKLLNDIQQYSDLINQQANEFYERRIIAYQRIQFILNLWNIPIKLFGSCASGITIKNSDIDIAIDNSILNYFATLPQGQRLKAALQHLQVVFKQQPCVTSLKLIKTAAIPLIKMKIDTSIKFIDAPGSQVFSQYIEILNREHISSGQIHVDLTIQTINKQFQCNHLGIISTQQINRWLKSIKPLHSIVIIIKNYLTKMNLNITYEGGINTYSMICMLVAFMKHNKYEEQNNVVMVFQQMLKFFIFQFDQKIQGIDLLNQTQIFYDKIKLKCSKSQKKSEQFIQKILQLSPSKSANFCQADLQIKDPLNNGKIMTKNCYSFPKIKQVFKQIYEKCFIQTKQKLQRIFVEKYMQKSKSANKKNYIGKNDDKITKISRQKENKILINKAKKDNYETKNPKSQQKIIQNSGNKNNKKIEMKQQRYEFLDNKIVNQLIQQCKVHINNPFLTLFQ